MRLPRRRSYGPGRQQFGELWMPRGNGPFPVAVVIHGGYWGPQYGRWLEWLICRDLVRRGWAAWNLEYRRLQRGGGWPMTFDDVRAGVALVTSLSSSLDLSCCIGVGHSAGGHLALWAAGEPASPLTAVVSQAGVSDMRAAVTSPISAERASTLLGGAPVSDERFSLTSPLERPRLVPALCVHGSLDETVAKRQSKVYATERGADIAWIEGEDHMAHLKPRSRSWAAAIEWMDAQRSA